MVSVVVVTYNGIQWLERCLDSIRQFDVILVDNNSSDNTVDFVKTNYPDISLFKQKNNLGFGAANNIGIQYALSKGAEYVFLLNQDAYLQDDSLDKMLKLMKQNSQIGLLSPIHLSGDNFNLDYNFASFILHRSNFKLFSDLVGSRSLKEYYEVDFVNAAAWLISKKCLNIVGGFDPIFFHYGEDENFCQRTLYHGFKIAICPTAFINHDRPQKADGFSRFATNLTEKETGLKIKFANININNLDELKNLHKKLKVKMIRNALKFNLQSYLNTKAEKEMIEEVIRDVKFSKEKNKFPGIKYLDYDF